MSETSHVLPPARRRIVMITVMAATMMVVLDTTIANVALPHMQASLGASPETVSWVLTSYIIASALAMPVTGWLSERFGRRALFTAALAGFTVSSVLCGISTSLEMMVAARISQGLFGAFIQPMSQAIMYDINPPEKHASAVTIWGIGVMVAPILGPYLGGIITDAWSWHWVFLINLPFGILTAIAAWFLIPVGRGSPRRFDVLGFGLLACALAAFQLALDRGPHLDWFNSTEIVVEAAVAAAAAWMFCIHCMTARSPLIPVALFSDRNFVAALVLTTVLGAVLLTGAALFAPMLQSLLGYPVQQAGLLLMPRGAGMMITMIFAGQLAARLDPRLMIGTGFVIVAWSLHMMTGFNLDMDSRLLIVSGAVQGAGMGLIMVPLNLVGFSTLPAHLRTEAAALLSLLRNLGGSLGIAVVMALLARNTQVVHSEIAGALHVPAIPGDPALTATLTRQIAMGIGALDLEVNRQSLMIAYINDYWAMMWVAILCIPLVLIMRRARPSSDPLPVVLD